MNEGRRPRRIDWSVATTFLLFWFLCWLGLMMIPSAWTTGHGKWQRTESWHQGSGDPVPDWFPVPVFAAERAERREHRGWAGTPTPVFVMAGATTYAEYAASGETLRVRVPSGEIVEMRRAALTASPPHIEGASFIGVDFPEHAAEPPDRRERFPWRLSGGLMRADQFTPPRYYFDLHASYARGVWAKAYLDHQADGSVVPGSARLHLRGLSRHAIVSMILSGLLAAIPAIGLTYAAAYASSKSFRLFD